MYAYVCMYDLSTTHDTTTSLKGAGRLASRARSEAGSLHRRIVSSNLSFLESGIAAEPLTDHENKP